MKHPNPKSLSRSLDGDDATTAVAGPVTYKDIVETVGQIDNASIAAILGTGASPEELAEAFAWFSHDRDAMGEALHPLSGHVEHVYCILVGDIEFPDGR